MNEASYTKRSKCRPATLPNILKQERPFFMARSGGLVGPNGLNDAGLALTLEVVTFAGDRHDVRVMQQPVQQRRGQRGILRERGVSLPERQIARHDQAALFVQRRDHLEEQVGRLAVHR